MDESWADLPLHERMRDDIAMASAYADEVEQVQSDLSQALERESRLQFALTEAGIDLEEPWHNNVEEVEFPEVDMSRKLTIP